MMAIIYKAIDGCACNTEVPVMTFHYENWRVIQHKKDIIIKNIQNKASATEAVDFLNNTADNSGVIT